jgi:hypothetical protein
MDFFALTPNFLELRYTDIFDQTVLDGADFFSFLNQETSFKFSFPPMMSSNKISGKPVGRFAFDVGLRGWKDSRLILELGSAVQVTTSENAIRMVSAIRTTGQGVPKLGSKSSFPQRVAKWLDYAHGITGPLFKETVSESVMRKFQEL